MSIFILYRIYSLTERYTPVSKNEFFEMVYRPIYNTETGFPIIGSHYLAIMYMVLAIGTLLDIDRPSHSQEATQYYELGRAALAVDSVFEEQSIPAIQALVCGPYIQKKSCIEFRYSFSCVITCFSMISKARGGRRWA